MYQGGAKRDIRKGQRDRKGRLVYYDVLNQFGGLLGLMSMQNHVPQ